MGFRTVIVLNNDTAHIWENDPELGKKIFHAASMKSCGIENRFEYGDALEQVHADVQTLAVLDGYSGEVVTRTHWHTGQTTEQRDIALLKAMAEKLGYRVSKKSIKTST